MTHYADRQYYHAQDQLTPLSANSNLRSPSPKDFKDVRQPHYTYKPVPHDSRVPPSPEILSSNIDSAFPLLRTLSSEKATNFTQVQQNDPLMTDQKSPPEVNLRSTVNMIMRMNSIAPGPFNPRNESAIRDGKAILGGLGKGRNGMHSQIPSSISSFSSRSSAASSRAGISSGSLLDRSKTDDRTGEGFVKRRTDDESRMPIEKSSTSAQEEAKEVFTNKLVLSPAHDQYRPQAQPPNHGSQGQEGYFGPPEGHEEYVKGVRPAIARQPHTSIPSQPRRGLNYLETRPTFHEGLNHSPQLLRKLPESYGLSQRRLSNHDISDDQVEALRQRPLHEAQQPERCSEHSNLTADYGRNSYTSSLSQVSNGSSLSSLSSMSSRSGNNSDIDSHHKHLSTSSAKIHALMMDLEASIMPNLQSSHSKQSVSHSCNTNVFDIVTHDDESTHKSSLRHIPSSPESPMNPAIQSGRLSPFPPHQPLTLPSRPIMPRSATDNINMSHALPACSDSPVRREPITRSQSSAPAPAAYALSRRNVSKGTCKGCSNEIFGKSVSSADGRLTGRYHKACFVCKTCSAPFLTADVYVHDNAPYCERHYHQLNGSMCMSCDHGIEGQYLETERGTKHHPNCLTCQDCRVILRNDYFEIQGRVYCERDAVRRSSQRGFLGPSGATSKMERRTTRMMMI